jgi:lantibiotic leader peptide-processing serine protease
MKCSKKILGFLAVLFFLCIITTMADAKDTRYVVVFENEQVPENAAQLIEAAGGRLVKTLPEIGVGIAVSSSPDFVSSVSTIRGIVSVSVERSLRVQGTGTSETVDCSPDSENDSCFGAQWNIRRVNADKAWKRVTTGSHQTVVAVIDTGIATNHPDLKDNVLYEFCCPSSKDECFSPSSRICNPYPEDPYDGYHGTQVASIIAASFGGGGLIGVGPNLGLANYNVWNAAEQNADDSSVWKAMLDAAKRDFKVINISLGGYYCPNDDQGTIKAWISVVRKVMQKSLIVATSPDYVSDITCTDDLDAIFIPSDLPGVISVGATGIRPLPVYPQPRAFDVRALYSYGRSIDLVAPGGDLGPDYNDENYLILTADVWPDPVCARKKHCGAESCPSCPIWYSRNWGNSLSAPHVSAVAGLIFDVNPNLSPSDVTAILKDTADDLGDPLKFGSGMVNAYRALQKAHNR